MRNLKLVLTLVLSVIVIVVGVANSTAGPALAEQGREFMGWIIPSRLTVRGFTELQDNVTISDDVTITGDLTQTGDQAITGDVSLTGGLSHTGNITVTGNIANRALFLRYQDVAAAPSVRAEAGVVSATTSITTSILGIETPRNVILTYVTVTTATGGNVTVAGVNARGTSTTENIAVGAISGTQTLTGAVPWASITSLTLPTRTEAVTLTVAGGQLFGLPIVPAAAGDVFHVTVNETPQPNPTVDTTNGTFNPVSTPASDVDYNLWVKQ